MPDKMRLTAKCSDLCDLAVFNAEGIKLFNYDGYAPYIKGLGGGDYIELEIDLATGTIIGWEPTTAEKLVEDLKGE